MKKLTKKNLILLGSNILNLVVLSVLTGIFAGITVTFYNLLMSVAEKTATGYYSLLISHPAFIPLLFLGLAIGSVLIGTVVRFVPMIRGSGIPQIEGAARGVVPFKWYVTLCAMFASSLACAFLGYGAGAEGPSIEIGGCMGSASSSLLKRNSMVRRMQIAGGASAGLAVAFNAPITGLFFSLEETFRSFSPQVFISASISVITALLTGNAIKPLVGMSTGCSLDGFVFNFAFDGEGMIFCLWAALASVTVAFMGVGFYRLMFYFKKLFKKITFLKGAGKYCIPFLFAGVFGLISIYSIGGGHSFIADLSTSGTGDFTNVERVFGLGLLASLLIIVVMRFFSGAMTMACGVPCGVFIPMLAMGAGMGAMLSVIFQKCGMSGMYSDYLVIICMAAFFTSIVKAPITGLVMIYELTGQFVNFVPAMLGIAIGLIVGRLSKTHAIYEKSLKSYVAEEKLYDRLKKVSLNLKIMADSLADGLTIRTIVWPTNGLVTQVLSADGKSSYAPNGKSVLSAGETITFECETDDEAELYKYLISIVGKQN